MVYECLLPVSFNLLDFCEPAQGMLITGLFEWGTVKVVSKGKRGPLKSISWSMLFELIDLIGAVCMR